MTVTVASFRKNHDAQFGNQLDYPDPAINYWLGIAKLLLNQQRWGPSSAKADSPPTTTYDFGTELFVAHNLVLEKQAADAAAAGGPPGVNKGVVSGQTVGPTSRSYDTAAGIVADAAHWNLTTYGVRFIMLARMIGSGGMQVGIGCAPPFTIGAWPGPYPYPEPGGSGFG